MGKKAKAFRKKVIRDLHQHTLTEGVNAAGGIADTAQNPHMPDGERLAMLVRSFGNVAESLQDDGLYDALIRLSGDSLSWAQVLQRAKDEQWTA